MVELVVGSNTKEKKTGEEKRWKGERNKLDISR
jgi:hypothetical protein